MQSQSLEHQEHVLLTAGLVGKQEPAPSHTGLSALGCYHGNVLLHSCVGNWIRNICWNIASFIAVAVVLMAQNNPSRTWFLPFTCVAIYWMTFIQVIFIDEGNKQPQASKSYEFRRHREEVHSVVSLRMGAMGEHRQCIKWWNHVGWRHWGWGDIWTGFWRIRRI